MPDRTQQTVKEKTSAPEIEILGPETAGALAAPAAAAPARRNDAAADHGTGAGGGDSTLRTAGAGEAARAVAEAAAGIDFGAVRPGPALAAMRDEIDDATADAIRATRRREIGEPRHRLVEGERPDDVLLLEGPANPEKVPGTLPAVLNRALVGGYEEWTTAREDPRWLTVYDLPGYRENAIRALGRTTFRLFPCFDAHQRRATHDVGDPLGEIAMMADFSGRGPSKKAHLDQVAGWLRQNGTTIDATVLEFPGVFEGYRPEIILTLSEDRSYLMVRDSFANGAPVEGLYVYSWKGGLAHYRAHLADAERVAALLQGAPRRPALAAPGRPGYAAPRAVAASRRLAAIAPPAVDPSTINLGRTMSEHGRTAIAALPQAASPGDRSGMVGAIRSLGFRPAKAEDGRPVFRRTTPAGSVVDLEPDDGLALARAGSFRANVRDASGTSTEIAGVATPARLEEVVATAERPAAAPAGR